MKGLLSKKYSEMTVGEVLKLSGGITILSLVIMGIGTAACYVYEKAEDRKWKKDLTETMGEEVNLDED
jgi:hypothetical protein